MNLNAEITQLVFNTKTLDWKLYLHIRGGNSIVDITAIEASSIIRDFRDVDEDDIFDIAHDKAKNLVYYMPRPIKK